MDDMIEIQLALDKVLNYAHENKYAGYNKYDALDSPYLMKMAFGNKYLRLLYSQLIMRSPINIRPLMGVPKTRNPKGAALFAMAYLNLFVANGLEKDLETAQTLLKWLIDNSSKQFEGNCWGYQYPWQDVGFFAHAHLPNRVVTFFVASAFLDAFDITSDKDYYTVARETLHFMLDTPKILFENDEMKCISYVPDPAINWIVMDVSALVGSLIARMASIDKDDKLMGEARRYINFVVDKQTDYGAWFYSHPAGAHTKMHDNYHTGYILDAILDYSRYAEDDSFMNNYHDGLRYYRDNLFLDDGTPKWMNNRVNPIDVHGSAQGIITFLRAAIFYKEYGEFAQTIAHWAIKHMQNEAQGFFYYQKYFFFRKPFTIMHWSNGWMARALSMIIRSHNDDIYKS
jgi:hypothetical protein